MATYTVPDEALKVVLLFIQDAGVADCEQESWEAARVLGAFMLVKPLPTTWAARQVMRRWSIGVLLAERKLFKTLAVESEVYLRRLERSRKNEKARADYYQCIYRMVAPSLTAEALRDVHNGPGFVVEVDTEDES